MALKTVPEYLESIRDGREVYLDGKRAEDVTTHPILKNLAEYASADDGIVITEAKAHISHAPVVNDQA